MTVYFYKTNELNGSNYIKILLRSNAILNIEKMINIVSYGQNWRIYILVIIIILIEFQILDNILVNKTFKVSILVKDSDVVMFTNLMN